MSHLLEIRNLSVHFGSFAAVQGVDITLDRGELLGVVGESGSGKSVAPRTCMVLMACTICVKFSMRTISNANGSLV